MPMVTFLKKFQRDFVPIEPINVHAKFVALPVPKIIGGTPIKLDSPCICPRLFFERFLMGFCSDGPSEYTG